MTEAADCTDRELMAVLSARELKDGEVVFAGIGIPLLASCLAQRLHAPGVTILFEGGVVGAGTAAGTAAEVGPAAVDDVNAPPGYEPARVEFADEESARQNL